MSYQVIARKWRPRNFSELVGQKHVTQTLENAIRAGRVAHAYIFSGIRGVGKTSAARILAKALNCTVTQGKTPGPCNECDSCRGITAGNSLDVIEIDAASNRGIDQIRELREMVRYAAAASKYKVVILDEAHQLTDEASNALLKTLEEPPENVVFILATTQAEDLVETLKSRAQFFQFRALSFTEIVSALEHIATEEKLEIDPAALAVLARAAEGSLRDALSLLEQAIAYCGNQISDAQVRELLGVVAEDTLDDLVAAVEQSSAERALGLVHRLIADGQNLQHFCREAIRHFRNLLVARVCGADAELITATPDERPRLAEQARQFSEEDLTRYFQILMTTDEDLRRKPDPRLHLELGLLKMVSAARMAPLEEVLAELRGAPAARATSGDAGSRNAAFASHAPIAAPVTSTVGAMQAVAAVAPETEEEPPQRISSAATMEIAATTSSPAGAPTSPAATSASPEKSTAATVMDGISSEEQAALLTALEKQKFLWSMVQQASRWELEGGEMRLYFPADRRMVSEMLQAREPMEKLRNLLAQVLARSVRVCVRLEASQGNAMRSHELRRKFEQDPKVRDMLSRFGGQISSVRRRGED
jgi:DNA polymerase-3 subunit gamma/tau